MPSSLPEVKVRASAARVESWKAAALEAGFGSFNEWACTVLDRACAFTDPTTTIVRVPMPDPPSAPARAESSAPKPTPPAAGRRKASGDGRTCVHRVDLTAFCSRC